MQKTGKITNIQPTGRGGYDGQSGWIHTFDMTIQTTDAGPMTGEIGSTSTPYPIAVGQEITVTITNGQYGSKFKRYNPRQQGGGQQQNQGGQGQRSAPPAHHTAGRDYDKENKGKCFCNYVSAMLTRMDPQDVIEKYVTDLWTLAGMSLEPPKPNSGFFTAEEQAAHDAADGVGDY